MPLRRQKLIEGQPSVRRQGAEPSAEANSSVVIAPEAEGPVPEMTAEAGGDQGPGTREAVEASEEGLVGKARPIEPRPGEPVRPQLDRLAEQIRGLQQQLDAFIARRGEAASETASQQVAAIVGAAEQSAAEIRASAEKDAATTREQLLADVQAEVERIRSEAQADAGRIRTEAHAEAARVRELAITEASAEIQAVCARLGEELQGAARNAIAGISGGQRVTMSSSAEAGGGVPPAPDPSAPHPLGHEPSIPRRPPPKPDKRVVDEVSEAVDELQTAAAVLEQSLRHLRAIDSENTPGA